MTKYIFSLLSLLAALLPLAAQNPGSLDLSFANQGVLLTLVCNDHCNTGGIAVQADNKILLVGGANNIGENAHGVILRYMPDGKGIDSTFGVNGQVESYIDSSLYTNGSALFSPLLLPDGRILAAVGYNFVTRRFLSDGRIDSSFHGTGISYFPPNLLVTGAWVQYGDMKVQNDGKILQTGTAYLPLSAGGDQSNTITARFTADGDLDTTFGANHQGYVITDLNSWGFNSPNAYQLVIQSDGKIVVGGMVYGTNKPYEYLLRYHSNGTLDSTFGTNGLVNYHFTNQDWWGKGFVWVQSDEKILVGVLPENAQTTNTDMGFVRFLPNGIVDSSYGTNGMVHKEFSLSGTSIEASLLQPDNKLIVSGYYIDDNTQLEVPFFMRYNTDGSEDLSFQYNGNDSYFIHKLALDNGGRILGAGTDTSGATLGMNRFFSGLILGITGNSHNPVTLRLFPNPSDKGISLTYTLPSSEKVSISLWNSQGQKVHTFIENQLETSGEHTHQLDIPYYLPSGTYLIQVKTSKSIYTTKWIK